VEKERLHFKIGLSGTYWEKLPYFVIGVNGIGYKIGHTHAPSGEIQYIEFDAEVDAGKNILQIVFANKEPSDTVKDSNDPVNFNIVKDMLLNIHSVSIDDIDLGMIVFQESVFKLAEPVVYNNETVAEIKNCVNLGFNGTWELEFESPFYLWLLEKI